MKKQLSILAGSILLASSAQAAITASSGVGVDSSVVLVLEGASGDSFVIDTGIDAGQLAAGQGFSAIDLSTAIGAVGAIQEWALFGVLGGTDSSSYDSSIGYYATDSGVVYGGTAAAPTVLANVLVDRDALNDWIGSTSEGVQAGFPADLNANAFEAAFGGSTGLLNSAATGLVYAYRTSGNSVVDITGPNDAVEGISFDGASFAVTNEQQTVIPVPAAAWLFGSALVSLGVVRRKK